jgi:D-arginine dehydrogenase
MTQQTTRDFDVVVIGGGIAGVSAAYEIAAHQSVCLVEQESTLSFHSTGRSAATFVLALGAPQVRALTRASAPTMHTPPEIFASELLSARPTLFFTDEDGLAAGEHFRAEADRSTPEVTVVERGDIEAMCPILRADRVALAMLDPTACDVDVSALHSGYTHGLSVRGGAVRKSWQVRELTRADGWWTLHNSAGETIRAHNVVNAAGAWSDAVAQLAGASSVGLTPLRRSVFMAPSAAFPPNNDWPTIASLNGHFYLKPEGNEYLCSPIDATLEEPGDPRPDELEIARAIESINTLTRLDLRHVTNSWAGQRTYSPDAIPVVGFDPQVEGFFWLAGQAGFGIQTSPAMARLTADLIIDGVVSDGLAQAGVVAESYSPARFTALA